MSVLTVPQQAPPPSTSAPFDGLPPEVIALIFLHAQHGDSYHQPKPRVPFEVTATHVSRRWRQIALECCRLLWCTIVADARCPLDRLLVYLRRSGDLPLRITYDHPGDGRAEAIQALIFLQFLFPHLSRCVSLRMRISDRALTSALPTLTRLEVPLLEECSISLRDADALSRRNDSQFIPCIFKGGLGAPRLSLLHLSGCRVIVACCPSLATLTTLHLHHYPDEDEYPSMTFRYFRFMIAAAPQLEYLSMHGEIVIDWPTDSNISKQEDDSPNVVVAPNLKFLALQFIPVPSFAFCLFRVLRAPVLKEVALATLGDEDVMHADYYASETLPSAQILTLLSTRVTSAVLPRLSGLFPAITMLRVEGRLPSDVLRFLASPGVPWPCLQELVITRVRRISKNGGLLVSSLRKRKMAISEDAKPRQRSSGIDLLRLDRKTIGVISKENQEVLQEELQRIQIEPERCRSSEPWWEATREKPWWMAKEADPFWANSALE